MRNLSHHVPIVFFGNNQKVNVGQPRTKKEFEVIQYTRGIIFA